jgi:hypothetical protein
LGALALGGLLLLVAASDAADFGQAVPKNPVFLTNPALGETDWMGEVATIPGGFLVAWTRSKNSGPVSVLARRFDNKGKPVGAIATIRSAAAGVGGRPELLPLTAKRVAVFWLDQDMLWGAIFELDGNAITGKKQIGKFGDLIHDVVRLSNGNIGVVMVETDISNPLALREKVSLWVLTAALAKVKGPVSAHDGLPADGWNMFDHTIVEKNSGGMIFFRDRASGHLMARAFSNAGAISGVAFRLNNTPMQLGFLSDQVDFQVKAARLSNGRIVVVWVSLEASGADGTDVRARMLDPAGKPLGRDFRVHVSRNGKQFSPDIVPLPNGRFAVLWAKQVNFLDNSLWIRTFNANGAPTGAEQQTEAGTAFVLSTETEAVRLSDGSLVNVLDGFVGGGRMRADGIAKPAP